MTFTLSIGPIVSLIAGVLILVLPRLLNYIIALYLIIVGLVGLFGTPTTGGPRAEMTLVPPAAATQMQPVPAGQVYDL